MDYVDFRKEVIEAGLLDRQYGYYTFKILSSLAMVIVFGFVFLTASNFWIQLLLIVGITVAVLQFAFLGHDAGHMAIFKSDRWNNFFGHIFFELFAGVGYNYWVARHNEHHANPNHEGEDPDMIFAQSEGMMAMRKGIGLFLAKRQHWLYFPALSMYAIVFQVRSTIHNIRLKNSVEKWFELILLLAHLGVFWVLPFFFMAWWKALMLVPLLRLLEGLYFGSVSATNHKGMRVIKKGEQLNFVEKQVLTTRNVRSSLVVDFVYGGLNYQIEHHLFPTMPRSNFKKCKALVMRFCRENSLPYVETGVFRSYRIILGELRKIALSGRQANIQPVELRTSNTV
ncbi:acyl-CoA desaturase [Candidatus Woesearchaeota archaeon]|nr:acyl-CoA desaturase [Candidatus Woesearchaeota archaeon]